MTQSAYQFLYYLNQMTRSKYPNRILCYGDSVTWGRKPGTLERFDSSKRYAQVLQKKLGAKYELIEEGLRGRMAFGENPYFKHRNGFEQFKPILLSNLPIDLIIIFLGTNDTNARAKRGATAIARNLEKYILITKQCANEFQMKTPKICFIAPPIICETALKKYTMFSGASYKTIQLRDAIKKMGQDNKLYFFDGTIFSTSKHDGVHLDEKENKLLGIELAKTIKRII